LLVASSAGVPVIGEAAVYHKVYIASTLRM